MAIKFLTRFANNGVDIRWSYSDALKSALLAAINGENTILTGLNRAQALNYVRQITSSNVAENIFESILTPSFMENIPEVSYTPGSSLNTDSYGYGHYYYDEYEMPLSMLPFITAEQGTNLYRPGNSSAWRYYGDNRRYTDTQSSFFDVSHTFGISGTTHTSLGTFYLVQGKYHYEKSIRLNDLQFVSERENFNSGCFAFDDELNRFYYVHVQLFGETTDENIPIQYRVNINRVSSSAGAFSWWCDEERDQQIYSYLSQVFGEAPPSGTWKSVTEITGTDGEVQTGTTQLAAVYDASIGDVNTPNTGGTWSDIMRTVAASENAQLYKVFRGMSTDETKVIAKSGPNILEATRSGNNLTLTFKLVDDGTETTIYTSRTLAMLDGTTPIQRYLGIIANYEEQLARLNIITQVDDGTAIHFEYKQDTITSQETGYLFEWLNASPAPNPFEDDTINLPSGGLNFEPRPTEENPRGRLTEKTALESGLFTAYRMNSAQLQALGRDLWNTALWADLKNFYNSPTDLIMGLFTIPFTGDYFSTADEPIRAADKYLTATGNRVLERYIDIDLGELIVKPRWDSYLDYRKYTKIEIHLPFIGDQELDANDIMSTITNQDVNGKTQAVISDTGSVLHLYYRVDVLTGVIVAQLTVNGSLMYEWQGSAAQEIPYSWVTRTNSINNILTAVAGGAAAIGGVMTANPLLAVGGLAAVAKGAHGAGASKSQIHTNGSLGGLAGALASTYPYVTITVPKLVMSADQLSYTGMGTYLTDKIGTYIDANGIERTAHGYVKVYDIHLHDYTGTDAEKEEIDKLLKEGVII